MESKQNQSCLGAFSAGKCRLKLPPASSGLLFPLHTKHCCKERREAPPRAHGLNRVNSLVEKLRKDQWRGSEENSGLSTGDTQAEQSPLQPSLPAPPTPRSSEAIPEPGKKRLAGAELLQGSASPGFTKHLVLVPGRTHGASSQKNPKQIKRFVTLTEGI